MKKGIRYLLVLALLTAALVMGATAEAKLPQQCSHCGKDVTWLPLSEVTATTIPTGHYYVDAANVKVTNKTIATSTSVCIYMNGNTVEADGVDRVFCVDGTLSVMGEGTVKGYGRNKSLSTVSSRRGGTVYVTSTGTFNLYDATVTSEKLTDSRASNGGNINVMGTFNMYSGTVSDGYASNAGGNIFVDPSAEFYMYGGSITGGTCSAGKSVCVQGKILLANDASINHLYLWDKSEVGFDSLLTVQGVYEGTTNVYLRKGSSSLDPTADLVVGASDNANLRRATLNFADSGLYTKISGAKLVLTTEDIYSVRRYCSHCDQTVTWSPLTEDNAKDESIAAGHYYLDFLTGSAEWDTKAISEAVCLDLNGQTLMGSTRAFSVKAGGELSIQGEGTVSGRGPANTGKGGTFYIYSDAILNLYGGNLTSQKTDGHGGTNGGVIYNDGTFNMYGGEIFGGYATNAGGNIFITPTGSTNLYGGTVGVTANSKDTVYCQGNLLLAGDAQVHNVFFTHKSGGPAVDAMLTVQGAYTGSATLAYRDMVYEKGLTVGISKNADLSHAGLAIEACQLLVDVENGELKLTDTLPVYTKQAYCTACDKDVVWTALRESFSGQNNLESGHYYLDFAGNTGTWNAKNISGVVCLDLNGQTLTGTTRAFTVEGGSILNLLGDGTVIGRGKASSLDRSARVGGTIHVEGKATLNQYGGTLTFQKVYGQTAANGGVVNVEGTYNLYDGSVENGQSTWVGGNIFVTAAGKLNLFGGTIVGGTASQAGDSVACRGSVKLSGDASVNELYLYPNTVEGGPALSEMLTVEGKYTGTTKLHASGITAGMDVGTAVIADLTDATVTTTKASVNGLAVYGKDLILLGSSAAMIFDGTKPVEAYENLSSAVNAFDNDAYKIVLFADSTEDIQLTRNVNVDLNGYDIAGNISGDGILYCMDAHTDDFTVADGVYGTVPSGKNVMPVAAAASCAQYGYRMIENDGKASFHCVKLQVTGMSLRASCAGLYYDCTFSGDELVKEKVESFGMVVSVYGDPLQLPTDGKAVKTVLPRDVFGANTAATSSMVRDIMKSANDENTNAEHADTSVYGRTYTRFTDGTEIYGDCIERSLREQICGCDHMYGVERIWDGLTAKQKRSVLDMYESFSSVMEDWSIPTISQAAAQRDDAAEDILMARRAQVVAKMRQMGDLYWRATEDVKYRISDTGRFVEFKAGRVYRGLPYAYARTDEGSFLEFAGEPDEDGIYPISGLTATHMGGGSVYARIGNDCSGSVNLAWSSVGADISGTQSSRYMIEANGYYKVGNYQYTPTEDGRIGISKEITAANGKEVMFESYAKVQPGDALDTTTATGGHVIMVVNKHVVYNADGSIDGEKSYIHTLEQTPGPVSITVQQHSYNEQLGRIVYDIYIEKNLSFNQAYTSGYLPITAKVLNDPTPVAEPNVVDSLSEDAYCYENLLKGELTCSRMISAVTITVSDENGQVFSYTGSGIRASIRKYYMQNFLTEDPGVMRGTLELDKLVAGNDYHCTVVVRLASGDNITVRDFDFTATDADISTPEDITPPEVTEPEEEEIPDENAPE